MTLFIRARNIKYLGVLSYWECGNPCGYSRMGITKSLSTIGKTHQRDTIKIALSLRHKAAFAPADMDREYDNEICETEGVG